MGIGKGLKNLRKNKNMTMEQLANDLNNKYPNLMKLTKGKISKWENEKEEPRLSTAKILAEYFNVKINDLYSDTDSTYKEDNDITTVYNQLTPPRQHNVLTYANRQLDEQNEVTSIEDYKDIDVNLLAAAGLGTLNFDKENPIEQIRMNTSEIPNEYDLVAKVTGDSMHPFYRDGEIIFIKEQHFLTENMIGLVEINGEVFLKKMYKEDDRLVLESLNKDEDKNGKTLYPKFFADELDDVRIIGKTI